MKPIDMTPIIRKYSGLFVALTPDRRKVAGKGSDPLTALREARRRGVKDPVLTRIPEENRSYLFTTHTTGTRCLLGCWDRPISSRGLMWSFATGRK